MSEPFALDRIASPIGDLLIAVDTNQRLRVLDFADHEPRMRRLLQRQYGDVALAEAQAPASVRQPIAAYFDGDITAIDAIPVETGGTPFQRAVWAALRTIPAGATLSYAGLARQIGRPAAVRAVGMANGANPVGIVVPCHRVIGADAALTGYGGGIERKRWLLEHEGAAFRETRSEGRKPELALQP
jgi:methylated-DNA-[protein]-cysteine S-methyltransferase